MTAHRHLEIAPPGGSDCSYLWTGNEADYSERTGEQDWGKYNRWAVRWWVKLLGLNCLAKPE